MSPRPTPPHAASSARAARRRTLFLLVPGACLLAGLDAGLLLLGTWAPVAGQVGAHLPARHGMLMVLGFLGTLIALERAVALRAGWAYAAPASLGVGGLALAAGAPAWIGAVLLTNGAALLLAVYGALYRRRSDPTVAVEALGAVAALVSAALWLRLDVAVLLPWLIVFIVATIAAERVELARLHLPPRSEYVVLGLVVALMGTACVALLVGDLGSRTFGVTLLCLVVWLAQHDVARRTIRSTGLPRFSAGAMLLGYAWLAVAAGVFAFVGRPVATAHYDVAVHATFLGFAMSMVLAHAPVILPAIVRRPLPYHPALWGLLALLQVGLAVRIVGALAGAAATWTAGSVTTVVALLLLPPCLVALVATAGRRRAPTTGRTAADITRPHPTVNRTGSSRP